jgi:lipopolysaccharide transport system ATP-binding protein
LNTVAVRAESLSKEYRLGATGTSHKLLRESIADLFAAPLRGVGGWAGSNGTRSKSQAEYIWALRDVSFDLQHGQVVGFIGRNGAGKSTLLKILSRITEPTSGRAELHGRVGSLLEVGTGFHPELTGRENIYLNGAILGMSRADIQRKFDEIVAFAELEQFLDTPVKRYSSGMYMRLAFAVAAHLEPEILLVDEVLAVGDAAFQTKCLRRMDELGHEGRTVIFVTHNVSAVLSLCSRAFLIDHGRLVASGPPQEIVDRYLAASRTSVPARVADLQNHPGRRSDTAPLLQRVALTFEPDSGSDRPLLPLGGGLTINVSYVSDRPIVKPHLGVVIRSRMGVDVIHQDNQFSHTYPTHAPARAGRIACRISPCPIVEGQYSIHLYFGDALYDYHFDHVRDAISFDVMLSPDAPLAGQGFTHELGKHGVLAVPADWRFELDDELSMGGG